MSHYAERKEKNCLNCGTMVEGRYCHNCGQENIPPKESVWHFIVHFFNDVTHFDGKFFTTLKDLLFKPGYLPREYMLAKRARYIHPIRMYLFTSFIFFLIFFYVVQISDTTFKKGGFMIKGKTEQVIDSLSPKDFYDFTKALNNGVPMSREKFSHFKDSMNRSGGFQIAVDGSHYSSKEQYDSLLHSGKVKDGWLKRKLTYKGIEI